MCPERSGSAPLAVKLLPDYDKGTASRRTTLASSPGLANSENPPLRFTAGADAVTWFEEQLASKRAELARWRALSVSLGIDA